MSIKYRTSAGTSASNFTDLVVKVGDTLPIGSEIDYDGQSVPAGWQEVAETNLGDVVVDSIRTKNMFDGVVTNAYIDTQGVLQNAPDWEASLNYIPVKQNTEYIVTASNMGARFIYAEYDSNRTVIGTRKEITPATPFTTSSTTKYVRFCTNNANATNIQLEEGSTATAYKKYQNLDPMNISALTIYKNNTQTATISAQYQKVTIQFNALSSGTGKQLTFNSQNYSIVVGANVHRIEISGRLLFQATDEALADRYFNIVNNGSTTVVGNYILTKPPTSWHNEIIMTPVIINVKEGDEITGTVSSGRAETLTIPGGTYPRIYLTAKVID